jgi:hypothetical protein
MYGDSYKELVEVFSQVSEKVNAVGSVSIFRSAEFSTHGIRSGEEPLSAEEFHREYSRSETSELKDYLTNFQHLQIYQNFGISFSDYMSLSKEYMTTIKEVSIKIARDAVIAAEEMEKKNKKILG